MERLRMALIATSLILFFGPLANAQAENAEAEASRTLQGSYRYAVHSLPSRWIDSLGVRFPLYRHPPERPMGNQGKVELRPLAENQVNSTPARTEAPIRYTVGR